MKNEHPSISLDTLRDILSPTWQHEVETYLEQGGRVTDRDPVLGRTILHNVVVDSHIEKIRWLVSHGADVDAQCVYGRTPLHIAVKLSCEIALELEQEPCLLAARTLLELGADPLLADNDGVTPRDIAASYGRRALIRYDAVVYRAWAIGL